jgi:threonine aldolase
VSVVDLRSDTVTLPTPEMYAAMASAELGDDVLGDDPTVRRLEELSAATLGHEDAMFVPSGTMGNQAAIATWMRPGETLLADEDAHVFYYEGGAPAVLARAMCRAVPCEGGVVPHSALASRALARSEHTPQTTLLAVENTHNRHGGAVTPPGAMEALGAEARRLGMKLHVDGARIFNAAAACGCKAVELARHADSVTFCLSKGLSAPAGSVLCGPREFIVEARHWRKRLGGGMRQAGLLAACGIVGLETMVERLAEDHALAARLASALAGLPGVEVLPAPTNIVIADLPCPAGEAQEALEQAGVRCLPMGPRRLRFVTHRHITADGVDRCAGAVAAFLRR